MEFQASAWGKPWMGLTKISLVINEDGNTYTIWMVHVTPWFGFGLHLPSVFSRCFGSTK